MVNINFTIFVETGLFLIFVALMYAYVLRPLLGVVDEREDRMREDEELANRRAVEAVELERSYFRELSELHQQASQRIMMASEKPSGCMTQRLCRRRWRAPHSWPAC